MDKEFFEKYRQEIVQEGIPGLAMNAPLTQNTLQGDIGLELECEALSVLPVEGHLDGIRGAKTKAAWTNHADGSLRGLATEYVLSAPALIEEVPSLVSDLFRKMEEMHTRLHNSNRCSTHVHKNMRGRTVNHITSMIALFSTFEDAFIPWCGEERVTNHFCLGTKDTAAVVNAWQSYLSTGSTRLLSRDLKYSALNVLPLFDRGSLEVRCGPKPDNAPVVILWTRFVDRLLNYAAEKYSNPTGLGHDLSERGGYQIWMDICSDPIFASFKNDVVKAVGGSREMDQLALEGFRRVQCLVFGHPWEQWMSLINKEFVPNPFGKVKTGKIRRDLDGDLLGEAPRAQRQGGFNINVAGAVEMLLEDAVQWERPVPDAGVIVHAAHQEGLAAAHLRQIMEQEQILRARGQR